MKYVFLVLGFVLSFSAVSAQTVTVPCGQQLQLQGVPNSFIPPATCTVGSDFGSFPHPANSNFSNVPSNFQPSINRTTASNASYEMNCADGVGQITSNTVNVIFQACAPTSNPTISATTPQICSPATTGTSIISWENMTSGESIGITVGSNVPPNYFATGGSVNGSQPAPWITLNPITFKLYRTTTGVPVFLDSIEVQGTSEGCSTGGTGICGDGTLNSGTNSQGINEQCDDGNVINGDGCSSTCQIQSIPSGFYCQTTTMCSACGGTSGVTCPATVYQSSACGGACPAGGTCGNGVVEGIEQCDQGAQNGQPSSTCSATCTTQTPTVPSADIGFDSAYTKNETIALSAGQTTTSATLYLTSANIPSGSCDLQQFNAYGNGQWNSIHGGLTRNISTTNLQSNLAAGTYAFRYSCTTTSGVTTRSNEAILTVESAPAPTVIDIGWTNTYSPKSKTVTVASGGVTNESLYVTTGGRTGCSLSGYMNSSNQVGVSPVSITAGFAYGVAAPQSASTYTYTLSCSGVASVSATLTVNSTIPGTPTVTCNPSPQNVPATFNWAASGFASDPTCSISGGVSPQPTVGQASGTFSRFTVGTSVVSCTGGTQTASANCEARAASASCGNGIVEPPEECDGGANCSPTCQTTGCGTGLCSDECPQNCTNDNSLCVDGQAFITSPANGRVLINKPFTIAFSFQNVGGTTWTNPKYQVSTTGGTFSNWRTVFGTRALSPISIAGILGGSQMTNSYIANFTAPGVVGSYPLAFTVTKSGAAFGDQCLVNGTPQVTVSAPECSDGIDNDGDGVTDYINNDPGCSSADDDDETDPAPGATLKISANPQLVRFGGSSVISYEVNNCTVVNGAGDLVPGPWTLLRDGAQIGAGISGTGTTSGSQTYPVYNIQNKTTFTLSCGGTTRSATISVIKINEI